MFNGITIPLQLAITRDAITLLLFQRVMAQKMKCTQPGPQHTDMRMPILQSNIVSRLTAAMIVENLITLK